MALTDPPAGQHTGPGYDDTPAGNFWRQAARPTTLGLLGRIARACYRHRRLTLAGWMAALGCLIVLCMQFGASADNSPAPRDAGTRLINQHFPRQSGDTLTLAIRSAQPVTSVAVRERVTSALTPFGRAEHVTAVGSPYQAPGRISADRPIAFATTNTHEDLNEAHGAELEPGQPQSMAGLEPTAKEI